MRRAALVSALVLIASALATPMAGATFPGGNGPILFRNLDSDTGLGVPLFRALPDGTQVTAINRRPSFFSDWRADGRRIAFDFVQADGDLQIATMKPDGSDLRIITSGPGIHEAPSWSPGGRRIVFDYSPEADPSKPDFETRLWTMRADGSHARALPMRRPGFDVEPKYSPNGRWIAFARLRPPRGKRGLQTAIMIVRAKGGRVRRLTPWRDYPEQPTPRDRYPEHPMWSPDSRWILFMCETQGTLPEPPEDHNEDSCIMDADGSNIVNLTSTSGTFENWPSWGPAPGNNYQG